MNSILENCQHFIGISVRCLDVSISHILMAGGLLNPRPMGLYAEARLGELIKQEQEAGRLATQFSGNRNLSVNNNTQISTLADYELDKVVAAISEFSTLYNRKLGRSSPWGGQLHTLKTGILAATGFVSFAENHKKDNRFGTDRSNRPTEPQGNLYFSTTK
jgi:hypothetical protein